MKIPFSSAILFLVKFRRNLKNTSNLQLVIIVGGFKFYWEDAGIFQVSLRDSREGSSDDSLYA